LLKVERPSKNVGVGDPAPERVIGNVRVDLRSGEARMSKEALHVSNVNTSLDKFGRRGVA
jgi:hypothetical protein